MKSPQYHVEEAEVSIESNLKDIDIGGAALDFEVDDVPEYDEELESLVFDSTIELELNCYEDDLGDTRGGGDEKIGEASADVTIVIEGEEAEFQDYIRNWESEGYRKIDWDFRYHIESGYITEVIAPLGHLVDDSFRGVLPGVTFTELPNLENEISEDKIKEINNRAEEEIKIEVVDYLEEELGKEIQEEKIVIDSDVIGAEITVYIGKYDDEMDPEHSSNIGELTRTTVRELVTDMIDASYKMDAPSVIISEDEGPSE